jgi:hypothetical protein
MVSGWVRAAVVCVLLAALAGPVRADTDSGDDNPTTDPDTAAQVAPETSPTPSATPGLPPPTHRASRRLIH